MQALRNAVARNPLAAFALAALVGMILADFAVGSWLKLVLAGGSIGVAVFSFWRPKFWLLLLGCTCTFGFIHLCRLDVTRYHPLHLLLHEGQGIDFTAQGRFVRAPMLADETGKRGSREARFLATRVDLPTRSKCILGSTLISLWLSDPSFVPVDGDYMIHGTLSLPRRPRNPGALDAAKNAERNGIAAEAKLRKITLLEADAWGVRLRLLGLAERCREWISHQVTQGIETDEMPSKLITSMALGMTEGASQEMQEPFRDSGTLHIFAVSGLHVGLLAIIGWTFLQPFGLRRERAIFILIPLMFGYAFITGWRPSAERSALMTSLMLIAPMLSRQARLTNGLGFAALVLWTDDTLAGFQAGFQLSFGVLWAIALGAEYFQKPMARFTELDPFLPPVLARFSTRLWLLIRKHLALALAVSFAAWLGSTPLMCWHFQSMSPISILANLLLVPLAFLSLFIVVLSLLFASIGMTWVQVCLNNANWLVAHVMMKCAIGFASIPGSHFPVPLSAFATQAPFTLSVLSLPAGQGAQYLQVGARNWMLDVGHADSYPRIVAPYLKSCGVMRLDGVMLSHADADHVGGMRLVDQHFHPSRLLMSIHEPWPTDSPLTSIKEMLGPSSAIPCQQIAAGEKVSVGEASMTILYPTPNDLHSTADDRAIVARIDYQHCRVLWCNDAGFIAEKTLLKRLAPEALKCDVLLRNQHASDFSCLDEFVIAVAPSVIICSSTAGDIEERLPAYVQENCRRRGITLFDTAKSGTVTIQAWPNHLSVKTWLTDETYECGITEDQSRRVP